MGDMDACYPGKCVEMIKACEIFYKARFVEHCHECQPLFGNFEPFESTEVCDCSIFEHFVSPWRCIPCVLAEQAENVPLLPKPSTIWEQPIGGPYYYERVNAVQSHFSVSFRC